MKKILAMVLAMMLVLSMSAAFAESITIDGKEYADMTSVTIDKTYTVTNDGTSYPDETFAFTIENTNVTDSGVNVTVQNMPTPEVGTVSFVTEDGTATKSVTITLPTYTSVGVYTYTIKETAGDTAGVEYHADDITLVVTVLQGEDGKIRIAAVHAEASGEKINDIENVYNAGAIDISKTVEGALGDKEKYFEFTVTLTGVEGDDYTDNVITIGGNTSNQNNPTTVAVGNTYKFYLKHGENVLLGNIPYGVTYTVAETSCAAEGYATVETFSDTAKKIDSEKDTVTYVNTKDGTPDTGIALDNAPYMILMALVVVAGAALIVKRASANR